MYYDNGLYSSRQGFEYAAKKFRELEEAEQDERVTPIRMENKRRRTLFPEGVFGATASCGKMILD